ncbi:hypothetical protein [Candidatus Allofournierella excrementavium]|uniref:hypothetical protein n=1 Tax=Candidatus Allofournierella excrementavium TaxID=2838591 RepID=UPI003AF4DAE4
MVRFRLDKKGVAVVCLWALAPGAAAAPFIFWQSIGAGLVFAAFWLGLCLGWLPARCESFEGSVTLGEVRMSSGLLFKTSRRLPTRWVSASARFSTPLLRLCRCCVLVLATSGALVVLPGLSDADADGLLSYLQGG